MNLALIGARLTHSLSPEIHRAYFELTGRAGTYRLMELPPQDAQRLGERMREARLDGVNVTIPYKKTVLPLMDQLSEAARRVGAVNTVARRDGRLIGHNTDLEGFCALLEHAEIPIPGMRFAVLGATGGAAGAVLAALEAGDAAAVYPVSRRGALSYAALEALEFDVLVNCTPVGMAPLSDASPVGEEVVRRAGAVVDLIYNPARTLFMSYGERHGRKAVNGMYMLVAQAVGAQAFWNGEPPDPALIRTIYRRLAREGARA